MVGSPEAAGSSGRRRDLRSFSWGFVDQGFSSLTNFALSLVAGRLLGPSGLGTVSIGFSVYLIAFGLQRSLLSEPLLAVSAALPPEARRRLERHGLTVAITGGLAASGALAIAGALMSGEVGHGLVLFAPWLCPALVQDYWRSVLFLEGRGGAAAANDGIWLVVMAAATPLVWSIGSTWAVIAWWGAGAAAGALLGFVQLRIAPTKPRESWGWWQAEAWPTGRWLASSSAFYSVTTYGTTFAFAGLLGTRGLGGLQAATVIFGPLSLLGAAFALPAIPALSRATAVSPRSARTLALQISLATTVLVAVYLSLVELGERHVLDAVFGRSFAQFSYLILPIGIGQLLSASAGGLELLLVAQKRGREYLLSGVFGQALAFFLAVTLAWTHDLKGAAWGLAAGYAVRTLARTVALRLPEPTFSPETSNPADAGAAAAAPPTR